MAYNTGNPIGSTDPRDLSDNSDDIDVWANSETLEAHPNRLGVPRKTMHGMETEFDNDQAARVTAFYDALNGWSDDVNNIIIAGGQIFADEEAGRAAVTDGQYYLSEGDSPEIATILWRRLDANNSRRVVENPSAELIYKSMVASSMAGLSGEFPNDSGLNPLYSVNSEEGETLFYIDESGALKSKPNFEFPSDNQVAIYALIDESGKILLAVDESGKILGDENNPAALNRVALIPYLQGNEIRAAGDDDFFIVDTGEYNPLSIHPGGPRSIRAVIDKPSTAQTTAVTGFADGGVLVPDNPKILHVIIGLGQSLIVGSNSNETLISTEQNYPDDVFMFDVGSASDVRIGLDTGGGGTGSLTLNPDTITGFKPLIAAANGNRGQTPLESFGNELARYCRETDNVQTRRLMFATGLGGTAYDGLRKGSVVYDNMLAALQKAVEVANEKGWRVCVDCAVLRHGESGNPSPEATYKDALYQWQSDVQADAKTITGQLSDVPFLICQPSSFGGTGGAGQEMAEIHAESPLHCVVAADYPIADLYAPDFLHGLGGFYYINGEYLTRAFRQTVWGNGGKNKITRMIGATRDGTQVTVQYEVPNAPLVFDNSALSRDVKGFQYFDDGVEVTIDDATVVDTGESGTGAVEITLQSLPSGATEEVRYAQHGHDGLREDATIPRGQLRDSAQGVSQFDGRPLYNWAIHQKVEVSV